MAKKNLIAFGDSVTWGQGHLDENKFAIQVARALGLEFTMLAHSGATIGRDDPQTGGCGPEAPNHYPTILQQLASAGDDPTDAALVVLDGGINDIGVQNILGPWTSKKHLRHLTRQYCHHDMVVLLRETLARYQALDTAIVVTSYFPVFSHRSDFDKVLDYLMGLGIAPAPQLVKGDEKKAFAVTSVELALQFWHESREQLMNAVSDVGSRRVVFADVPFTEDNAMFTDTPWLFNVRVDPHTFRIVPEDDVIAERHTQCERCHPHDPFGIGACDIASAGHPNRDGAVQYTKTILDLVR